MLSNAGLNPEVREYKKAYGQFSSNKTQKPETLKPYKIELDTQEGENEGVRGIDFENGDLKIKQSGAYLIIACPQIGKLSGVIPRWIDFWVRVNGIDVPNSNIRCVIQDPEEKIAVMLNLVWSLNKNDTVNIMMAKETNVDGLGIEAMQPVNEPTIPSIIVTIVQLD